MAQTKRPTAAERERRQAQKQAAGRKTIFGDTPGVTLPGIGTHPIRFRNPDLAYVEEALTPLLDRLPDRLSGRWVNADGQPRPADATDAERWEPYENVWDALEVLGGRYVIGTMSVLLYAGLRHAGVTEAQAADLDPSVYRDDRVTDAVSHALRVAFGEDGSEGDDDRPTEAAADR